MVFDKFKAAYADYMMCAKVRSELARWTAYRRVQPLSKYDVYNYNIDKGEMITKMTEREIKKNRDIHALIDNMIAHYTQLADMCTTGE